MNKNNHLTYRAEYSRSLEDAEKFKALETLKSVGLFIPMSELDTFHGRAGGGETFKVDPYFKNGGNDSGNWNVNPRTTLYTTSPQVAQEFGQRRAYFDDTKQAEVHEIVASNPDALVLNMSFRESVLSDDEKNNFRGALQSLHRPILEAAPVEFTDRAHVTELVKEIKSTVSQSKALLDEPEIREVASRTGIREQTLLHTFGAFNASVITLNDPRYMIGEFLRQKGDVELGTIDAFGHDKLPINFEYVESWLKNINCVGVKQRIRSTTVGRDIESVSLFDLRGVNTKEHAETQRRSTERTLGSLALQKSKTIEVGYRDPSSLLGVLDNAYVRPRSIVQAARKVGGYKKVFEADAGNWEGYSLQEHTETVLRNFDNNYADRVPVELLTPMRLAILAHDIGKPIAAQKGEKHRQAPYNEKYGKDFLIKAGVDEKTADLLIAVGVRGSELAFTDRTRRTADDRARFAAFASKSLHDFYEGKTPTDEQVMGFMQMSNLINVCDGGAYTTRATTRMAGTNAHYRNSGSFDGSFMRSVGLGGTDIVTKH